MSYYLRELYSNIKWERTRFPTWLKEGELPSCIIRDLRADDNALSIWEIDEDKSNLPGVIAALVAAQRKSVKNDFDYALIAENHLNEITFKPIKTPGKTPYGVINVYHRDIQNLSINGVVYFADLLSRYGELNRMDWREIVTQLKTANEKKQLDLENMDLTLKEQLQISAS
jgi:hypothetical protein